jgi:hypothetical protein
MKSSVKYQEILRGLEEIPADRLNDIEKLINSILAQTHRKKEIEPKTLKGIWAKKGFERIVDLEKEIQKTRRTIQSQILNKKL